MVSNLIPDCCTCLACCTGIFKGLDKKQLDIISDLKNFRSVKEGDYIFKEGETPEGLYCIYKGIAKIFKTTEENGEDIVRFVRKGEFTGYRALLCSDIYRASAIAVEDVEVCFFKKDTYLKLLHLRPEIACQTVFALTNELRFAENRIMNIKQQHAKGRIAEILLVLEEFYGVNENDQTVNTAFVTAEIGHMAGTTYEITTQALNDFTYEGIIEILGDRFKINNKNRLVELSNRHVVL